MRCLVTGVAGFLGSNLLARLLAEGHSVAGLDDLSHGSMTNLEAHLANPRFTFTKGDVRAAADVDAAAAGCDAVVHLAAGKIPRYGNSLATLDTNLLGGRNVLEACRKTKARAVIASTSDVYGMSPDLPFREDGRLVLGSPHVRRWSYAATKLADEHLAIAYAEEHGVETVSLRFFGSYGPRQNLTWWGGPQSVFIGAALRGEAMEIHGDGLQTRSFTYVTDTVDGIVRALTTPAASGRIVNVGDDREISIADLARMIWRLVRPGTEPTLRLVPYATFGRYDDPRRRVPDTRLAEELLGFRARVPLEEGLPRTIAWQARALGLPLPGAGPAA